MNDVFDVCVTEFTDPACPWAGSAEPFRRRLQWLYGERLDWSRRMVVLSDAPEDYLEKGFTPAKQASAFATLARDHGMPIDMRCPASSRSPPTTSCSPTSSREPSGASRRPRSSRCSSGPASRSRRARLAVVCDIAHEDAREELGRVASERHLGFDGLWSARC